MAAVAQLKTHIINYSKTRDVYAAFKKSQHKKEFRAEYADRNERPEGAIKSRRQACSTGRVSALAGAWGGPNQRNLYPLCPVTQSMNEQSRTFQPVLSTFGMDEIAYFFFCWYGISTSISISTSEVIKYDPDCNSR